MDENKLTPGAILGGVPKKWAELTSDEKIEILREELRMSRYTVARVYKLEDQARKFLEHQHGQDGKALFPHKEDYGGSSASMTYDRLA